MSKGTIYENTLSNVELELLKKVIHKNYEGIIDGDKLEIDFWHAPVLMIDKFKVELNVYEKIIKKESELCRISALEKDTELNKNIRIEKTNQEILDIKIVRYYNRIQKNYKISEINYKKLTEIEKAPIDYINDIGIIFELEKCNIAFFIDNLSLYVTIEEYKKNIDISSTKYLSTFLKKQLTNKDMIMQEVRIMDLDSIVCV